MKVKSFLLIAILLAGLSIKAEAQEGIVFEDNTWSQIINKAQEENKLIFVDFYTQWCGPCFSMAEEVFVLPSVADFYNKNFVNAKIDAENGEGIELAKKYGVRSYPTYLFIDPQTGDPVHKSSSRQEPETFIFTGKSALEPSQRSFYLTENFESNKGDINFLQNYIKYTNSIYDRKAQVLVLEQLGKMNETLDNAATWKLFVENISGNDNFLFKELYSDYNKYTSMYGKNIVDEKLTKETSYAPIELIESLPNFEGKKTNLASNKINLLIREKQFEDAITIIDSSLGNEDINQEKFLHSLRFAIRNRGGQEYPDVWLKKCGEYLQYIAYNNPDRNDAYLHFEYAQYLESLLKQIPEASKVAPETILNKPAKGKEEYSMRSDRLLQKPTR